LYSIFLNPGFFEASPALYFANIGEKTCDQKLRKEKENRQSARKTQALCLQRQKKVKTSYL